MLPKANHSILGVVLSLVALFPLRGYAQTDTTITEERIAKIEAQLAQQESAMAALRSEIDAVTKQNLALKKNLNLQPTVATSKAGDVMEYRVMEVTGNPSTKEVRVTISSNVIGNTDKRISYFNSDIIDELGAAYDGRQRRSLEVRGNNDDLFHGYLDHHPNAPYTLDLLIKDYNPEAQYIKYLSFDIVDNTTHHKAVFENLPIKWIANE